MKTKIFWDVTLVCYMSTGQQHDTFQETVIFPVNSVRTSNLTIKHFIMLLYGIYFQNEVLMSLVPNLWRWHVLQLHTWTLLQILMGKPNLLHTLSNFLCYIMVYLFNDSLFCLFQTIQHLIHGRFVNNEHRRMWKEVVWA